MTKLSAFSLCTCCPGTVVASLVKETDAMAKLQGTGNADVASVANVEACR